MCHICVTVRDSFSSFSYILLMKFSYLKIDHVCFTKGKLMCPTTPPPNYQAKGSLKNSWKYYIVLSQTPNAISKGSFVSIKFK